MKSDKPVVTFEKLAQAAKICDLRFAIFDLPIFREGWVMLNKAFPVDSSPELLKYRRDYLQDSIESFGGIE